MRTALLIPFCLAFLWAHGGRTDSQGGHNNRSEGNYHFHSGPLAGKTFSSREEAEEALRSRSGESKPAPKSNDGFECGTKTTCGQMSSCEEARFYLNQCGLTRLDGDKDGTPCESLCK